MLLCRVYLFWHFTLSLRGYLHESTAKMLQTSDRRDYFVRSAGPQNGFELENARHLETGQHGVTVIGNVVVVVGRGVVNHFVLPKN